MHFFLLKDCSVLELYVHGVGGQRLRKTLLGTGVVPNGAVVFSMWTDLLPKTLSILLEQLYPFNTWMHNLCKRTYTICVCIYLSPLRWPSTNSVSVCQFLLSACQYTHLQVSCVLYLLYTLCACTFIPLLC